MHITSLCWFSVYRDSEPKYSWDGSQWERTASPAAFLSRASTIYSITRYYIQRVRLLKTLFPELLGLVTSSGELTGTLPLTAYCKFISVMTFSVPLSSSLRSDFIELTIQRHWWPLCVLKTALEDLT